MRTIQKTSLIVTVLLCAAALAFGQGQMLKRVITKTDKLDFGAGGTVEITGAPNGSIRVEATTKNEIEFTAEITVEGTSEEDLATLEGISGYVLDESLGRLAINSVGAYDTKYLKQVSKKFPKRLMGTPLRIDYSIKIPRYCDLQIDGGKGDITVKGIEGLIKISSLESNTNLDLVGGGLVATFGKGSVNITLPERSWHGGAVIDVGLATGDMAVFFPANFNADLDASVLKTGKIENSLLDLKPRIRTAKFTDTSVSAKAGIGGTAMKFTVGDGTLKLKTIGKTE
jgi:hypothetical protein